MRLLTNSLTDKQGLETIQESDLNDSQNVVFCVPINKNDAKAINSIGNLRSYLRGGISTKILIDGKIEKISLRQRRPVFNKYFEFQTTIFNKKVRFYISKLNKILESDNFGIEHYYSGNNYNDEFADKKFVILEPNLDDLDKLYIENRVIFVDYNS